MKKAITFILLLLANMVLLAHSVIPHHHHNEVTVCFNHCADNETSHEHETNDLCDSQQHEKRESSDCCPIKNLFLQIISNKQIFVHGVNESLFPDLYLLSENTFSLKISELTGFPFREKPHIISYHSRYLTHSLGLRAPPSFC